MASSSNTFVENWSDADHDNIFINKILQSGELKQQFLEDFTLFHYQLPIGMPNDVRVELNAKHDGESTMQAALDFLHKGLANCLEEGWSRKVLEALKENNQAHLSELFKPTESDRENYLQHKKKLEEAEKRRKEQKKAESADDNAKQGMTSNIQKNDGNIVQQFIKVHGGATVHIGGHISGEQSKISNKSDEFSEHDSESLADLVRKGQSKSRKSSSVSEKSIVMDKNSEKMEILKRNNKSLATENKNLKIQLNSQKESFNRDVSRYEEMTDSLAKNISYVLNEQQNIKIENKQLQIVKIRMSAESKELKTELEDLKEKYTIVEEEMSAEIKQLKIEKRNKKKEQNKIKQQISAEINQLKTKLQDKEEEQNAIKEQISAEINQLKKKLQDKEEEQNIITEQMSAEIKQLKNELQDKEEEQNKIKKQMSAEINQLKNEMQDKEEDKKIMLFGGRNNPRSCYSFSFSSQQWTKLPDLPSDRRNHGLAVIGRSAYMLGGENNKDVEEYNCTTKKFRKLNSMKTSRSMFKMCVHTENEILIAGGWENRPTDSCFLYDTIRNKFETIGSFNTGRYGHALVNEGNTAYAIGGADSNDKALNTIEVLDETTQKWKLLETTLIIPRYFHQAVVHKNSIYIIGGKVKINERTDIIEKFDLRTGRIKLLNVKLKLARNGLAVAKYMNDLYIIGGYTGNGKTSTVEIFDLDKEEMREGKELPVADYAFTACVL